MTTIVEASWTGSERQRRPQGICLPPKHPPRKVPRFFIPAGTSCTVSKISPNHWRPHVTRRDLGFDRYEEADGASMVFREQGYFLRVARQFVVRRA
jgi:hypothetical protein